ncbi:MAG TPA: O-antigen ligase family protein [Pirellulaceae bacterium]|jgi:O-antigen ligase
MSTIATPRLIQPCYAAQNTATYSAPMRWSLLMTALIVGLVFFVAGHDFFTSRAVAYTQSAEEMQAAALGGNLVRRIAFFMLAGWGLILLAVGKRQLKIDWPLAGSLLAVAGLATASVLWSEEPAMCIRRLLVLLCCGIAAAGAARAFSLREIAWLVVIVVGSLAAIGVLTEVMLGTFRPWASDYRFAGTVHPNTQGPALAALCLGAFSLVNDSGRFRPLLWSIFSAGMLLLVLTKSRTAAAALLASLAAVQVMKLPLRTHVSGGVATAWIAAAGLCSLWICGFDPATDFRELFLLGRSDESESLSGRTLIWPEVIHYARERFWLGYGYEGFWTPARIEDISDELGWGLREAHNGYLEMWLWLGAIGVVVSLLTAIAALAASVRGFRETGDRSYSLPLGLIVFGLFNSCLESGFVVISLVPFLLGCCLMRLALFRDQATFLAETKRGPGAPRVDASFTVPGSRFAPG